MRSVAVRIDDFERGDFPAVCAKTGVPCANAAAVRLRVGVRPVRGVLPIVAGRVRVVRVLVASSWLLLFAGVLATFAALWILGAAIAIYAVLFVAGDRLWVGSRQAETRDELVITRVHPNFATAVDAQYGR